MNPKELENDEVVLEECMVSYGNKDIPAKLILTNERILFLKEKGWFQKKYKVFQEYNIDHIKVYKNRIQMRQSMSKITIHSSDGNIVFCCENILIAKKIFEKISSLRLGDNYLTRTTKKAVNVKNILLGVGGLLTAIAKIPGAVDKIGDGLKSCANMIKGFGKK